MAPVTKGSKVLTMRDVQSGKLPDGTFDRDVVEMLAEEHPSLIDIPIVQCNDGSNHVSTIRTGIATAAWMQYYKGVPATKGSKKQVINSCGTCGTKIMFDRRQFERERAAGTGDDFLADEASQHGDALGNAAATALFYGDIKDNPLGINGLSKSYAKYGSITSDDSVAANYVINCKGTNASTSALRSIWLVGWGTKSLHALAPKGTSFGLKKGMISYQHVPDDDGNLYEAGIQDLTFDIGLCIKDFRYACRLCNIQLDQALGSAAADYFDLALAATIRPKHNGVRQYFYMSKKTWEIITRTMCKLTRQNAVTFGNLDQGGTEMPSLFGRPVHTEDALEVNETEVAAEA